MVDHAVLRASATRRNDFAELHRQVRSAGLLERRTAYYVAKIAVTDILLAAGIVAFAIVGDSWWQMAIAAFLAIVFTQLGFIGHDAGHRQIFRGTRANTLVGLFHANVLIGLSYGWWVDKHNRHHASPNQVGRDPDIGNGAVIFTAAQQSRLRGVTRVLVRYQAWYFFPLLTLEALNLHAASVRTLSERRGRARQGRGKALEASALALHAALYLTSVFLVLSPLKAVMFIVVHQGVMGIYLGCAFAPNHKGMLLRDEDDDSDHLRCQVLTSRNVRGSRTVDWVLGGLNYQIEHHLFPSMPRPNLRHAQPLVRAYCANLAIAYHECGLLESYGHALRSLRQVGIGEGGTCEIVPAAVAVQPLPRTMKAVAEG